MDPYAVLGLDADAGPRERAAAYRRLAKRWHPDRGGGEEAQRRMAEINVAFDLLRAEARHGARGERRAQRRAAPAVAGAWLPERVRGALGPLLLAALHPNEPVALVTPASTWASPEVVLALTDRRLLWQATHAISPRVHALRFADVVSVEQSLRRPLRRTAVVRLSLLSGRRMSFAELRPATGETIAGHVRAASARAA